MGGEAFQDLTQRFHGALRYGFQHFERLSPSRGSFREVIDDELALQHVHLLHSLANYDQACRLYAAAHAGLLQCEESGSVVRFHTDTDFSALEVFELCDNRVPSATPLVYFAKFLLTDPRKYLRLPPTVDSAEREILTRVTRDGAAWGDPLGTGARHGRCPGAPRRWAQGAAPDGEGGQAPG